MNSEQLIIEAGDAIAKWQREHLTECQLYIIEGHVRCKLIKGPTVRTYPDLRITRWQQQNGFNHAQWNIIGTELFNQYNKELACHAHQKP